MTNSTIEQAGRNCASDDIVFAPESAPVAPGAGSLGHRWKVLIVDDDPEVHTISTMVLRDFELDGEGLELISAYSGAEAKRLLEENPDIAVILLDVVMETDRAGLDVVVHIREVLHNRFVRIILRTGQPGEAPERWVVVNYDINDYKEKTELTSDKLTTAVLSSLRAYRDITAIESSRRGLELIISSSRKLFEGRSLSQFCTGVLHQLTTLLNMGNDAIYAHTSGFAAKRHGGNGIDHFTILAGTGSYADAVGSPIAELENPELVDCIREAIDRQEAVIRDGAFVAYFPTSSGSENVVYTQVRKQLSEVDRRLLRIFATNLSVAFDNLYLNREIAQTQIELIYTLGEVVESRCQDTGHHVRRVAEYSKVIGHLLGLPQHEIELLQIAAPLHDLGKIGIPDSVLHKQGSLTQEEMATVRRHTSIGHQLLKGSGRPMLRSAALVAQQHHEWWDGTGYPNGMIGKEIHLFGRIVGLADTFDALTHKRPYKEAWPPEKAFDYIVEKRGIQFDPELVDLMLSNKEAFIAILNGCPD